MEIDPDPDRSTGLESLFHQIAILYPLAASSPALPESDLGRPAYDQRGVPVPVGFISDNALE